MFLQFWIISEDSRRLPKISEGNRRGIKIAEDRPKIVRRTLRKLSPETKNPPETVNIKKLANLTANTKNYGQITLNTTPHSDPQLRPSKKMCFVHVRSFLFLTPCSAFYLTSCVER